MFMNLRVAAIAAATLFAICSLPVLAADYDESVDGDLADLATGPTLFDVTPGLNTVTGTVGEVDFEDFIGFTIEPGEALESVTIDSFVFAGGNTSTGFRLYADQGAGYFQASTGIVTQPTVGLDYLSIWDLSDVGGSAPLPPGDYGVLLAEFTAGQAYSFSLDVSAVPEPSGLAGLLIGLSCLLCGRRKLR